MFREVSLPLDVGGRLYLHSMPGRYEPWDAFEEEARQAGIDTIVCLAPDEEIATKSSAYEEAIRKGTLAWPRLCFPIGDYSVPEDREAFIAFVAEVADLLQAGRTVLVHCGAGIGRTGTFAICLLMKLGMDRTAAEQAVTQAGSHPETDAQRALIEECAQVFQAD